MKIIDYSIRMPVLVMHALLELLFKFRYCNSPVNSCGLYSTCPQIIASEYITIAAINAALGSTPWLLSKLSSKQMELRHYLGRNSECQNHHLSCVYGPCDTYYQTLVASNFILNDEIIWWS